MTYIIKDQERVKKLTEIWKEFPECLKDEHRCELYCGELNVEMNDCSIIHFEPGEFGIQADYTPHAWNEFPNVTPPEGIWMRCEWRPKSCTYRTGLIFRNGRWEYTTGEAVKLSGNALRFRPWDDEDA